MSKGGHLLTTAALACVVYAHGQDPVLAGGVVLGSSLPDVGEGVVGYFLGRRISLLAHRSISHWLPLYVVALFAIGAWGGSLAWWESDVVKGLCIGASFHIALDSLTPAGVPLLTPFGRRVSFGPHRSNGKRWLYRTGTLEEWPVIAAVTLPMLLMLARAQWLPSVRWLH